MKKYYKPGILSVFGLLAITAVFYFFLSKQKEIIQPAKAADIKSEPMPDDMVASIHKTLEKKEYSISYDSANGSLQSPNRQQNLRAYYRPGNLTVKKRVDSTGQGFKLGLSTVGVLADGKVLYKPDPDAATDTRQNHLLVKHPGFSEEYLNDENGIRQNFIIQKVSGGARQIEVRLAIDGLTARESGQDTVKLFENGSAQPALVYRDLKCWDAAGSPLPASIALHDQRISLLVDVSHATFPVTIDPIIVNGNPANAHAILESNQTGANAGYSVASAGDVNGDGYSDVLVGAPFYDKGENDEGAVFVYHGSGNGLNVNAALLLEGNQVNAQFGTSVGTAGDVNGDGFSDALVGAPLYDKGETDEGAAFLYYGSATGLKPAAATIFEANQAQAHFGQSVATAGDANADGYSDVLIGAPLYDKGQTDEGAVFVYKGTVGGASLIAPVVLEINQVSAAFGFSVAGAGDVNGDGFGDVIVGAILYDEGQLNEGGTFIFHGSANGLNGNVATKLQCDQAGAVHGWSVSSAGDVNGDGYSDVIVGAYSFDKGQVNEGAAFVYQGSVTGISTIAASVLEVNQNEAQFGMSVAAAGDVNGDGFADVIVGAKYYDAGQTNEGAAFVYQGSKAGISANPVSTLESNQNNAWLGGSVSSAGDVNGDGYSDVICGAPTYDKGQGDEGAAFIFHGSAYSVDLVTSTVLLGGQDGAQFGWSVASAGDVNGDGFGDVIIGANEYDNGQADEGAAFLYYGSAAGLNTVSPVILEINKPLSAFGSSVASAGDVNGDGYGDVVVGAYLYDNAKENAGAIFVFHGSKNGIVMPAVFVYEGEQESQYFGKCVSTAGDVNSDGYDDVIAGAPEFDVFAPNMDEGGAIVLKGSAAGITIQDSAWTYGNINGYYFGSSVSSAGDINGDGFDDVVIGSPYYGSNGDSRGAAIVHFGSISGISKNPSVILEGMADATLGRSVANGGDINGDGFSDILAGADRYSNGQYHEGACFVYYGSSAGPNQTPEIIESNSINAGMGNSVRSAGDINGDGYSDIIVGALGYSNGQFNEGAFSVYTGSAVGIKIKPVLVYESNQDGAFLGHSVSGAGDVNGDGYSDIVVSGHQFDQNKYNEGVAYVAYGNTGVCLRNNLRLYNSDLITNINHSQFPKNDFGAGLYSKSFLGKNKGKLVWETRSKGQAFSKPANGMISNSTQFSGAQNAYSSLALNGTELKNSIAKQGQGTKVRTRVKYDPVLALTGQLYGPWKYLPSSMGGSENPSMRQGSSGRESISKGEVSEKTPLTTFIYPNPASDRIYITAQEGTKYQTAQIMTLNGIQVYRSSSIKNSLNVSGLGAGTYLLVLTDSNGLQTSRKIVIEK